MTEDTSFLSVGELVTEVRWCWWVCRNTVPLHTRFTVKLFMGGNAHYEGGENWEEEKETNKALVLQG